MANMTDYAEQKTAERLARGTADAIPATWYLALFTSAPSDVGGGTEVSGMGYARVAAPRNEATFGAATSVGGVMTSASLVDLAFPGSLGAWGTVTHYAWFDAATGGNMWFHGTLPIARVVDDAGITIKMPVGSVSIGVD